MSILDKSSLVMIPSGYKEDKLYSVKPRNGDGDFTFTRASTGTRVNADGYIEEVPWNYNTNSEDLNSHTKLNVVVTSDDIISPIGTQDADKLETTSNNSYKLLKTNSVSFVSGSDYTFSFYAKKGTTDFIQLITTNTLFGATSEWANFDLNNGVVSLDNYGGASIEDVGNEWFRCSMTSTCVSSGTDGWYVSVITSGTSTRAETTTNVVDVYVWGLQVVKGTSAKPYIKTTDRLDIPRLDYSGGATNPTLLLEPQRTNYVPDSENWTGFSNLGVTKYANQTDINGGSQAMRIVYASGVVGYPGFNLGGTRNGKASIYIKSNTSDTYNMRMSSNTSAAQNITVTPTWQRITVDAVNWTIMSLDNYDNGVWAAADISTCFWQMEEGNFPTSYIPTSGTSVTRNLESGIITSATDLIGQTQGTLYSEFDLTEDNNFTIVEINLSNSTSNRILAYRNASYIQFIVQVGGVIEINNPTLVTFLDTNKIAVTYQTDDFKIYLNGSLVKTYTSGNIPSGFDTIDLQDNNLQGRKQGVKSLILFKEILTNDELEELTTI